MTRLWSAHPSFRRFILLLRWKRILCNSILWVSHTQNISIIFVFNFFIGQASSSLLFAMPILWPPPFVSHCTEGSKNSRIEEVCHSTNWSVIDAIFAYWTHLHKNENIFRVFKTLFSSQSIHISWLVTSSSSFFSGEKNWISPAHY